MHKLGGDDMNQEQDTLDRLIKRRGHLMRDLEWAVNNSDSYLAELLERELKITMKNIKHIKEQVSSK